jgi:formyltetrahydrofolate-dependent phosphoribosylglycinamide formyltransferase
MTGRPVRLGVLFSGGGRTLENLAKRIRGGTLAAEIAVSISSRATAGGTDKARRLEVPLKIIDYQARKDSFSEDITAALDEAQVDLVVLAGFLRLYRYPPRFEGRIMNIHPALLPAFGGKGFYGDRVHEAVLEAGVKFSGCTVHFVNAEYDKGAIVLQRIVPVHPNDSVDKLAERVFAEECVAYPEAIRLYAEGKLEVVDGRVRIREEAEQP